MARIPWLVALAPLLVAVTEVGASGADPVAGGPEADGLSLEVMGACPEEAAVRRLADQLMAPGPRGVPVSIQDLGPRYRVTLLKGATTFDDPGRDCPARARQAVALMADELRPHPRAVGPPQWTIEKGLVFDVASSAGGPVWAPGAEIRGAYGPRHWSLVGAAGARGPVTLTFQNDWKADLLRLPLDLGGRFTMYRWRLRPWVVVGGSVTVTGIEGVNVVQSDRVWRLDPGALLLAGATLPVRGRIGLAAALNVRWQPRPYQLDVVPAGKVGETPSWWFGLSLNYTIDGQPSSP